jgi:hypothetical protein
MTEPVNAPDVHATRVRIGHDSGRRAERIALVVGVLVLIAVVKPWGSTPVAAPIAPPQQPLVIVTPMPTLLVVDEHPCNNRSWLIQVDMLWPRQLVRSWILTDAVAASGPTDTRIRFVTAASPEVRALGYCPARSDDVPPDTRPTIYRLGPPVEVVTTEEVTDSQFFDEQPENVLYRPAAAEQSPAPSGASVAPTSWAAGRYVLRIDGPSGFQRWLGLEIRSVEDVPS